MLKKFLKDKSGASAMVFAMAAPIFLGGITLAVELGNWQQKKSKLQDLADSSAIAAAQEILILGDNANYLAAGKGHAFSNGFNFSQGNMTVTTPPASGTYAGRSDMVEVVVSNDQEMFFSKYFGSKSFKQNARATAIILEGVEACILALSPTAAPGISAGGSSVTTLDGCGVHSNSSATEAINIDDLSADCISSVGGIVTTSNTTITQCDGATQPYSRYIRDPYEDVSVPSNVSSMPCATRTTLGHNIALKPGRICTKAVAKGLLYFSEPGTYYVDGVTIGNNSTHSAMYGRGVTLVFINGGDLTTTNGGTVDMTAATSGLFAGISMYWDPDTTPSGHKAIINGNSSSVIEGVIYAPTSEIRINGGASTASKCMQLVGDTVRISGNADFTNTGCEAYGARQVGGQTGAALVQ